MSASKKPTIPVAREEVDILMAIRQAAPSLQIKSGRAEMYGMWTLCYKRYCDRKGIPFLWMDSVSQFMDFLDGRTDVSPTERNRALDGIMFYLSDVRRMDEDGVDAGDAKRYDRPRSTRSLFAQLLLRCDIQMTQAFRLRFEDVDVPNSTVHVPGDTSTNAIEVPPSLRSGLKAHLRRLRDRASGSNPLLFGHRGFSDAPDESSDEEDAVTQSTQAATRVMQMLDTSPASDGSTDSTPGPSDSANASDRPGTSSGSSSSGAAR